MDRRKFLRSAQGLAVGAGLWTVKGFCSETGWRADHAPTRSERVCLVGMRSGWLAVEMLVGTQRLWLDQSRYTLTAIYWDELGLLDRVVGYFGPIPAASTARWADLVSDVDHFWMVGLDSFGLRVETIRNLCAFLCESCARVSLTVETEPSLVAAFDALVECKQLVPYSRGNLVAVPDYAWDRFNDGMQRIGGDVLTRESEDLYRRYQWESCDALTRSIVEAFARSEADRFRPSDVVPPGRRGWA